FFLSPACRKSGASWDTDISTPVFKSTFGINKLISDSLLHLNTDSSLTLVYSKSLTNYALDSLIHIPDTTVTNEYNLPVSLTLAKGTNLTPGTPNITAYSLHGVGLKTANLHSGKMRVMIRNKIHDKIQVTYQIPMANFFSVPFNVTVMVPACVGNVAGVFQTEYDLINYTLDLSGPAHNSINTFVTQVNAILDPAGPASVLVSNTDSLIIQSSFVNMVPSYAKGYFGQTVQHAGPSESPFGIFSKFSSGSLLLQSVQLNFHIENGIGVDARLMIPDIYSKNSRTGNIVHLTAPIINNPININRAIETFSNPPAIPSTYTATLNNSNSNTKALIENMPDKLGYQMSIAPDPLGNVSGYNDFIYYGYGLNAGLDLQVPLALVANNLTLADTLAVNFDKQASNINRLHQCSLTLYASNGFPLSAAVQLYTVNEQNIVTDSLFTASNIIGPAPLDINLKAIGTQESVLQIPVPNHKISNLVHARKLIITVQFNTSAKPSYLKIYDSYLMDFRLTGDFNYTIKVN
ncbi:MAG TPA: hypothetical protein VNZ86_05025, partial [Bacteroidia bacterium]|nr:hypothetical protein [Bacteroidia bacterium]